MAARLLVSFGADEPAKLARFWADLLGRHVVEDSHGLLVPGADSQLGLRFVRGRAEKIGPNPMHIHLTSMSPAHQQETVAAALALGGHHQDVGQSEDEEHVVLADPEGNEFCVIEPGNSFLAGCGFLGELACDGTRDVGVFWSEVTGWPLVWDQDEETAIQSPRGGTKIAWGGPPVAAKTTPQRQHFDLTLGDGDRDAEVDRLIALGASRHDVYDGAIVLVDPDGNEFCVQTS